MINISIPRWSPLAGGILAGALTLGIVASSAPLARAQVPPLGTCAQWQNNRQSWIDKRTNGDLAGMSQAAWQAELTRLDQGILVLCGDTRGDDPPPPASSPPPPQVATPPPTVVPLPHAPPLPGGDQDQPPNPAACLLLSQPEVDAVISAAPNADDPLGFPSPAIAGCDYIPNFPPDYAGLEGSLTVIYFLSGGLDVYGGLAAASSISGWEIRRPCTWARTAPGSCLSKVIRRSCWSSTT